MGVSLGSGRRGLADFVVGKLPTTDLVGPTSVSSGSWRWLEAGQSPRERPSPVLPSLTLMTGGGTGKSLALAVKSRVRSVALIMMSLSGCTASEAVQS